MNAIYDINEPNDASEYIEHALKISEMHGVPEYVIGVTFGVDIDKWRSILKNLFGNEFQQNQSFDKAFLLTDKVSVIDTNKKRDLWKDNLKYKVCRVSGYLHTKFIIVFYKDYFVLLVSSKNISNSASFDILIPFKAKKNTVNKAGEEIANYLDYLEMDKEKYCYDWIQEYGVESLIDEKIIVRDFQIAYTTQSVDGKPIRKNFTDELWNKIIESNMVISPYLEEEQVNEVLNKHQNDKVRILAYPKEIKKLNVQCRKNNDETPIFYMGKLVDNIPLQYKFHSKIYAKYSDDNTLTFIFGSANLTKEAKERHCEMLVEIEMKREDAQTFYNALENVFTKYAENYDVNRILLNDDEEEDAENGICRDKTLGFDDKIFVEKRSNKYQLHVCKNFGTEKQKNINWGELYENPVYFVTSEEQMICIKEENYISDSECVRFGNALTFADYKKEVLIYLEKFKKESDLQVLLGRKADSYPSQWGSDRNEGKRMKLQAVPCFYNALYGIMAQKTNGDTTDIETLKNGLEELRSLLNGAEYIKMIDGVLKEINEIGGNL